MRTVGVRKLKENLSKYLSEVKAGERIVVTERNKEVALIVPVGIGQEEDKMLELIRKGLADWSGAKPAGIRSRIRIKGKKVSETVLDSRR